ncbi:MAG: DUF456 domain-containing protein [Phycisphaerae bacterium]|nr:DUF456 domain-containing protein [Phycisphaerae bacterium]
MLTSVPDFFGIPLSHVGLAAAVLVINMLWLVSVCFGAPGTWLMVLTMAVAAWVQRQPQVALGNGAIGWGTLIVLVALAVIGEVLEFVTGATRAKKAGASSKGSWAAIGGGILGAILGTVLLPVPPIGTLVGASAGAGVAAWQVELRNGQPSDVAIRIGWSAAIGRLLGTVYKLAVGVIMWILTAIVVLYPLMNKMTQKS